MFYSQRILNEKIYIHARLPISNMERQINTEKMNSDMLKEMFEKQKILQKRLHNIDLPVMTTNKIPMAITSIIAELGEILEEQQAWKDWKKNPKPVNQANLDTEIADLWHFIINLSLYLNYDADDIYREFMIKNKINHQRQNNKY